MANNQPVTSSTLYKLNPSGEAIYSLRHSTFYYQAIYSNDRNGLFVVPVETIKTGRKAGFKTVTDIGAWIDRSYLEVVSR